MDDNTNRHDHLKRITHQSRDEIRPSSVLIIAIPIVITILIIAIVVMINKLCRLRFSVGDNGANSCGGVARSSKSIITDLNNCKFDAHRTTNISSSPGENGGCLYGSSTRQSTKGNRGVQVFTLKEAEMATDKFSETNLVRHGVYKGVLRDGTVVAVETFSGQGRQGERAFRSQVDLLSQLCCPYIAQLLGYCADQNHRLLVFEHMSNGSLQDHLHSPHKSSKILNWGVRLRIALDCARALEYLHEKAAPSIIHRNFNSTNILLNHHSRAKLSGFEFAKVGSHKLNGLTSTRVLGATGYLAPEYASTGKLTTKSDVYSYGVTLLELLTGRVPIDITLPPGEHVLVSWALPHLTNREKVVEMIDPALQNLCSKKDLFQVAAIAAMCVQAEADYRPLMTDVVQSLIPLVKNQSHVLCSSSSL